MKYQFYVMFGYKNTKKEKYLENDFFYNKKYKKKSHII